MYNFETDSERKINQQETEGPRYISHMILKIINDPITNEERIYVALEARTHIFPSQLKKVLNKNLKDWYTEYSDDERNLKVYPEFEIHAYQSDTLEDILKTGKIKGLKLLKITPISQG